jgi:thioredoxin-dependent peroxiredoxin
MEVGDKVKNFSLPATDEETISLKDLKEKIVVLYFYPRDNTPGCTTESQDFARLYDKFVKKNIVILGISRDTVASHDKFKCKFDLPFPLLADTEEKVCEQFGVMKDKNMYGKKVRGIERSTFVIGKDGKITHVWRKVKVPGHAEEVLATIA